VKSFVSLQFLNPRTVGRTPWTGDQPVAMPLQTQNKRTDIHALSGIRTHDPSVRAGEDSSCFRPLGHCDGPNEICKIENNELRKCPLQNKFLVFFIIFFIFYYCT
jgi:hypothetical protein